MHPMLSYFFVSFVLLTQLHARPAIAGQESGQTARQWYAVTLDFIGPETSETASPNPFTDYRLQVTFKHSKSGETKVVRGYYAADGNAANTHADSGNVWRAKFAPGKIGKWDWTATLRTGENIAIGADPDAGKEIPLSKSSGHLNVVANEQSSEDFRTRGFITVENQRFKFMGSSNYWVKGGADSPENFLAFADFDGTYRIQASDKDGEAKTDSQLHRYLPHVADWKSGDASWTGKDGSQQGQAIIGSLNYLASKGINSVYFLTMNIGGDGKDVWPYLEPTDVSRFDCSKLDQWEIVFDHMQQKGIALHVQLQETENETMLDNGDTGPQRKLYFHELVSRFAHHPALVWNLGEENGPAEWTPVGQTPAQRIAMADFLKSIDPYNHPVLMHTHADSKSKNELLTPLLGAKSIDGLSFQVSEPEHVHRELIRWSRLSKKSGHQWLISMDEIGLWHTGVKTDAEDPNHDPIRRHVLWGSLFAGGAGVEWYFGARSSHNDLTSEDWRERDRMWELTSIATTFLNDHLPHWEMESADDLVTDPSSYCLAKRGETYAVYFHRVKQPTIDLESHDDTFSVRWYDPLKGGKLQAGSIEKISGPGAQPIGKPPHSSDNQDWVVVLKKIVP